MTLTRLSPLFALACAVACGSPAEPQTEQTLAAPDRAALPVDDWTYVEIDSTKAQWGDFDEPEWLRYFGLAMGDVDGDGHPDIVTGRNVYLSPGDDLTGEWTKEDLGRNVDANLIAADAAGTYVLAEALPDVVRLRRQGGGTYSEEVVAAVPPTGHHNGQGYRAVDVTGDGQPEMIYASLGGLYVMEPSEGTDWPVHLVAVDASDEGFAAADMDGDGDVDLVAGYRAPGGDAEVPTYVSWYENAGTLAEPWTRHEVGRTIHATDRVEAADFDGDGRADVAVAEERYPGLEPDANLWVYLQRDTGFARQQVVEQFSMNNLHAVDIDRDGDVDLLTSEHKGDRLALQAWLNDGSADFSPRELDRGKESHLGARAYDMDGDGDDDVVSIGWDQHQYVHLWRNDAIQTDATE